MPTQSSPNRTQPTSPSSKPKYVHEPFSAWKAYIDDGEQPDHNFINWKKKVLGENVAGVGGQKEVKAGKSVKNNGGGENPMAGKIEINGGGSGRGKDVVLRGRENERVG